MYVGTISAFGGTKMPSYLPPVLLVMTALGAGLLWDANVHSPHQANESVMHPPQSNGVIDVRK
jgi:hypothetical protein